MVPLLQGAMASGKFGDAAVAPGSVTEDVTEVGQLVSFPVGTSEYWYANCALVPGATVTVAGEAFACGDTFTESPSTSVTVIGDPVDPKSPMVG
jgi:hypothetical protein